MKIKNIVSFGAGVNSIAMIALLRIKKIKIDEVIFADPGAEEPETYEWLENQAIPYFKREKIKFTIVHSKLGNIYDYYYSNKIIPFVSMRECTDKFKIRPIKKYIEEKYSQDLVFCYIGYDGGEPQRAYKVKGAKKHYLPYVQVYPLLQYNISRSECKKYSQMIGLTTPPKSRCYFCPFRKKEGFIELYKNHPDLYQKVMDLEENCFKFPKDTLLNKKGLTLRMLRKAIREQTRLFNPLLALPNHKEGGYL